MMDRAFAAGQGAWPGVNLDKTVFEKRMRELQVDSDALARRPEDLYLAAACLEKDPVALGQFERGFLTPVTRQLGRVALDRTEQDELLQRLRVSLLVGESPKLLRYRGSGPLGAWVRVCALRLALEMGAAAGASRRSDEQALDRLIVGSPDSEVLLDVQHHREAFRTALQDALAALNTKEKTLLRLHFLERMNIDALASVFLVHRATVARWLVAIRTGVLKNVRRRLSIDLGATPSEAKSLVRLLGADVELSVHRILERENP
jgi:RNA polymerase sigma-70 factor, ECF subfamily